VLPLQSCPTHHVVKSRGVGVVFVHYRSHVCIVPKAKLWESTGNKTAQVSRSAGDFLPFGQGGDNESGEPAWGLFMRKVKPTPIQSANKRDAKTERPLVG
jgi:hypothetical protein